MKNDPEEQLGLELAKIENEISELQLRLHGLLSQLQYSKPDKGAEYFLGQAQVSIRNLVLRLAQSKTRKVRSV